MRTDNLFVGRLGKIVEKHKGTTVSIRPTKDYIIFEKNGKKGIDVFTGKLYYIWAQCEYDDVRYSLGENSILQFEEITKYMDRPEFEVSLIELRKIYERLNGKQDDTSKCVDYPKDLILRCILETDLFLKRLNVDDDIKEEYSEKLRQLGDRYVSELLELKNNRNRDCNFDVSESTIRERYLRSLITIEDELKHLDNIKSEELELDLSLFKKCLELD